MIGGSIPRSDCILISNSIEADQLYYHLWQHLTALGVNNCDCNIDCVLSSIYLYPHQSIQSNVQQTSQANKCSSIMIFTCFEMIIQIWVFFILHVTHLIAAPLDLFNTFSHSDMMSVSNSFNLFCYFFAVYLGCCLFVSLSQSSWLQCMQCTKYNTTILPRFS